MNAVEARMRAAFELHELAVAMRREALARQFPDEDERQIEARLRRWIVKADASRYTLGSDQAMDRGRAR